MYGENLDLVTWLIDFAKVIGSFLCFQGEQATFKIGTEYFPVCSGCFGIYLGSLIALIIFPFLERRARKLYSIRYGLPMLLPMTIYGIILTVEEHTGTWIVPGSKELYFITGILFGLTIANAAFVLNLETSYADDMSKVGRKFWILAALLFVISMPVFVLYEVETATLFAVSLVFLFGFFGLIFFILAWLFTFFLSYHKNKTRASNTIPNNALASVLTILVIFVCFLLFQSLILESKLELMVLCLLFGTAAFIIFGYSVSKFKPEELGLVKKDWEKQILYGVFAGVVLYLGFALYRFFFFNEIVFYGMLSNFFMVPVVFAIVVSEEFFFRGYAIPMLEGGIGKTSISCIVASAMFVVYHQSTIAKIMNASISMNTYYDYERVILLFLGSLLLSYFFVKKRSLVMPIATHLTWNLLVLA